MGRGESNGSEGEVGEGCGLIYDVFDKAYLEYLDHTIPGRSACIASTSIGVFLDVLSCFSLKLCCFLFALCFSLGFRMSWRFQKGLGG